MGEINEMSVNKLNSTSKDNQPETEQTHLTMFEENFKFMHTLYYDKQLRYYYDKYMALLKDDTFIGDTNKTNLQKMFTEYLNSRVIVGNNRHEDIKALDMFNVYIRNGKPIDMDFIQDVGLVSILRSKEVTTKFLSAFQNKNIAQIMFDYWGYVIQEAYRYNRDDSGLEMARTGMYELVSSGIITAEVYQKLCNRLFSEYESAKHLIT